MNQAIKTKKSMQEEINTPDMDTMEQTPIHHQPKKKSKKMMWIAGAIALVLIVGGGFYYYYYTQSPAGKEAKAKAETASLIKQVSKLMILPTDDEPAIFDITDPSQLSSQQAFFAGAEKGDKLMVYSKTAKAIIYSPKRDVIVIVGPVTFDQNAKNTSAQAVPVTPTAPSNTSPTTTPKKQ
jgi:hypothetical protein